MKDILFGDLFDNFTWKKKLSLMLMVIVMVTLCITNAPIWFYILGIFGPAFLWWKLDINKEYKDCKFIKED